MIFGDRGGLKFPDLCLTGEDKPRKNLTQEICPDRGSNPGPLRDKRACYHLRHLRWTVVKTLVYLLVTTSFGKNFAIFRPSSVVDHIDVDVVMFDVCY